VGSFERNVMSTGRKFAELNIETGKRALEDVPEVEALPRYGSEAEIGAGVGLIDETAKLPAAKAANDEAVGR
jgi:DNA recombination protein RmuC